MPQLEGPTTKNIQLCTGGVGGEKAGGKKRRLATVVSSGANFKQKEKIKYYKTTQMALRISEMSK